MEILSLKLNVLNILLLLFLLLLLLSNSENHEWLKILSNIDCAVTNHNKVQEVRANHENHKLTTVAVCGLDFSHLIGFLFAT